MQINVSSVDFWARKADTGQQTMLLLLLVVVVPMLLLAMPIPLIGNPTPSTKRVSSFWEKKLSGRLRLFRSRVSHISKQNNSQAKCYLPSAQNPC